MISTMLSMEKQIFLGLVIISATLRLAQLQVYTQRRSQLTDCYNYPPLSAYGDFNQLSSNGLIAGYLSLGPNHNTGIKVRIIDLKVVCHSNGLIRGSSTAYSVIVHFECTAHTCPNGGGITTEQFHLNCVTNGGYSAFTHLSTVHVPGGTVIGTLNTSFVMNCSRCYYPTGLVPSDPETHCFRKFGRGIGDEGEL